MSDLCHVCGPVKHEAPTAICAPCALSQLGREHEAGLLAELIVLRIMRDEITKLRWLVEFMPNGGQRETLLRRIDGIVDLGRNATRPPIDARDCHRCGSIMISTSSGERCLAGCG